MGSQTSNINERIYNESLFGISDLTNASLWNNSVIGMDNFQHAPEYIFVYSSIINVIIFLVGVIGNILVFFSVLFIRQMRSPTNYFLFTLSIADLLLLLICQPAALVEFHMMDRWYIGSFMCKMIPFLENGMLHVSILTMLAMTTERFYAIIYPFKKRASCSTGFTVKAIIGLWIFAYCCTSPFLLITKLEDAEFYDGTNVKVCRTVVYLPWHKVFVLINTVAFFVLPFFVLLYMYSRIIRQLMTDSVLIVAKNDKRSNMRHRSRKQVVRMLIFIIILFFITMCPIRVVSIWQIYTPPQTLANLGIETYYNLIWFARMMMYINSAGNPVIYCITSSKFKTAFKRVLQRFDPCRRREHFRRSTDTTQVLFKQSTRRRRPFEVGLVDCMDATCRTEDQSRRHDAIVIRIQYQQVSSPSQS